MEARQNFWLLFKEMIVNAVKHSHCTEMGIALRVENNFLTLTVSDNGLGFDAHAVTDGRGVRNIRERAALLGGELRLETSPGHGTRWELVKPM
jgi:signal transduction histidine kinase